MAEKPILFNTEMVRAILDGRKTQTRRIAKTATYIMSSVEKLDEKLAKDIVDEYAPFQSGDILWVRETWAKDVGRYMYRANYSDSEKFYMNGREIRMTWRPSIHMPKEAARLFLRVTGVRCERLQEITSGEAVAEGIQSNLRSPSEAADALIAFEALWNSTMRQDAMKRWGWNANPWVWVIEFERIDKPKGWCES